MALRNYKDRNGTVSTAERIKIPLIKRHLSDLRNHVYFFERNHSNQSTHTGHIGVIQAQQREDGVSLRMRRRVGSWPEYGLKRG